MYKRGPSIVIVFALLVAPAVQVAGQSTAASPRPEFEVASVRVNKSATAAMRFQPEPGGRLVAENVPLRFLIMTAYDLPPSRISGGPNFAGERYDIQAKAPEDSDSSGESTSDIFRPGQLTRARLQTLLEDRFQLKYHWVTEQRRVYALTVTKGGPVIKHTQEGSCIRPGISVDSSSNASQRPNCGFQRIGYDGINRTLEMRGVPLDEFARVISTAEVPGIIDRTGLAGTFDISLRWTHCPIAEPTDDCGGPSIFTAMKEQLGLKVEPSTGPVRVMVIDHVEKPSAN